MKMNTAPDYGQLQQAFIAAHTSGDMEAAKSIAQAMANSQPAAQQAVSLGLLNAP